MRVPSPIWKLFAASIVLAVAILGIYLASPSTREYAARQSFDSARWQASLRNEETEPIRLRMIDDLLQNHQLEGRTKAEIHALLGKPPETPYFKDYEYVYWLGPERGYMSIDSEWLGLKFDEKQRVTAGALLRD